MNAIIETGSKQFRIKENDIIEIDRIEGEDGQKISFPDVLAIGDGKEIKIGKPFVKGAIVEAEIIAHIRGGKIIVFKMKRRKGYKRKQGHRQELTKVKITKITP